MQWSYSGNPATAPLDEVRFLIGDITESDPQLADDEILYLLTKSGNPRMAAAQACEALASRYAGLVNRAIDGLSVSYSDKSQHYLTLASHLRSGEPLPAAAVAGGLSKAGKALVEEDEDRVPTRFSRDLHLDA